MKSMTYQTAAYPRYTDNVVNLPEYRRRKQAAAGLRPLPRRAHINAFALRSSDLFSMGMVAAVLAAAGTVLTCL